MSTELYIGMMSGTSMDGVDAVIAELDGDSCHVRHTYSIPYSAELRAALLDLHTPAHNELELAASAANQLAHLYAETVRALLASAYVDKSRIRAIGCHGQTIRHRPELGFTLQLGNAALLAELLDMTVVADFRSRDVAAGGQGAPLVPAFHQAVFAHPQANRAVINIGGIANITDLPSAGEVRGFDSGPGNMLMDAWTEKHLGERYDAGGRWAATGVVIEKLLQQWLQYPYFSASPPKSTGRDSFNMAWLEQHLEDAYAPEDVQRTLLELTARSIANAINDFCDNVDEAYICGGGAHNTLLLERLQELLPAIKIRLSDSLGIGVNWVEAAAFAWLAQQCMEGKPANLPAVTGAKGPRILGAIYAR